MADGVRGSSLRWRLLAAFAIVAAVAVGAFAGLTLWSGRSDVQHLLDRQQKAALTSAGNAAADTYREAGSWGRADLRPVRAIAITSGAFLQVRDAGGNVVTVRGGGMGAGMGGAMAMANATGPTLTAPVIVDRRSVGAVTLRFETDSLPPAERQLRDALSRTAFYGAVIAILVALAVAYGVAVGITRPLERLTHAVQRLGAGDRSARANLTAPGELGILAHEVDAMAARLEREDELRRALTADVAHELRTPVSILRAHCEAIVDDIEEPTPELMHSLHDEVIRLGDLIEDVQTLSAAEAAVLRLERAPVDLADIVQSSVALLAPHADTAEITMSTVTVDADVLVAGDAGRLAQVVRNLVLNALKFTPTGGNVDVSVAREEGKVILRVTDDGKGISAADLPHVFERYWRGGSASGTRGSGIGLAVVHELVHAHHGVVRVTSEPGNGTTFAVELPALHSAASVATS